MLVELSIQNFAIIDSLRITFTRGMNILSGETGAGKSIIISAVNLILGDRAQLDLIRTGSDEAVVEAMFHLPKDNPVTELLSRRGIDDQGEELLIKRIISRGGKSRVLINGSMTTLVILSEVGEELINISGQHEHQTLLRPDRHIDIIDSFGNLWPLRRKTGELIRRVRTLTEQMESLRMDEAEKERRIEFLRFQIKEIDDAKLAAGEEEELREERTLLANAEKLFKNADEAHRLLYAMENSASENIAEALSKVRELAELDKNLGALAETLAEALYGIEDAGKELESYASRVSFDPERLDQVQERLRLISSLKKKYAQTPDGTITDILAFAEKAKAELSGIEMSEENIQRLKGEIETVKAEALRHARELGKQRRDVGARFSRMVEEEVSSLGMQGTRFVVNIDTRKAKEGEFSLDGIAANPTGIDRVEFFISPNVGEEPRALARIASGGELSRLLLAMKKTLAQTQVIPTLIFDEVDSGIGGGIAQVVGKKLKQVSSHQQVICITHLPQIASFADTHYSVVKDAARTGADTSRTITRVERLSQDERVMEIARMLGGEIITETTLNHAKEMIETAR
ncbi:MAG: DNA repair protein RecN [Deltaproteobacteria bacterium]|nr:DNA repair protein RecN [Candidatus Zymogenaceae bacterium]